jgi:ribosome-binding ATPase
LITVERKLERLNDERKKGQVEIRATIERELALFERLNVALSEDNPLRNLEYTEEEQKILSGFGLLTRKPMLIILQCRRGARATPPLIIRTRNAEW